MCLVSFIAPACEAGIPFVHSPAWEAGLRIDLCRIAFLHFYHRKLTLNLSQRIIDRAVRLLVTVLAPVDALVNQFKNRRELLIDSMTATLSSGAAYSYTDLCIAYESFLLTGTIRFEKNGTFGFAFDYNGRTDKYKTITLDPAGDKLSLAFNEGDTLITETAAPIEPGKDYTFTSVQEGSVGILCLDGIASLTVRLYGVSGRPVRLFVENNTVTISNLKQYTR